MDTTLLGNGGGFYEFSAAEAQPPKLEKMLFFLLGNASLLAFNIIINAIDIYVKLTGREKMGFYLSWAYNIPCSCMAFTLCFLKPKNLLITLSLAMVVTIIATIILPILFFVKISQDAVFYASLAIIGVIGISSSTIFSSSFSFAAQYNGASIPFVAAGNGLCGIIASALRIITKAIKDTPALNAAYFAIAAVILILTLIYFIIKSRKTNIRSRLVSLYTEKNAQVNSKHVISKIWVQWISVFLNFCITLSLFPGFLAQVKKSPKLNNWETVIITSTFCLFDLIGRSIPSYTKPFPKLQLAWIPIVLRLAFYGIFISSIKGYIKVNEPYWTFGWTAVFAITNGYSGTVCMMYGNSHPDVKVPEDIGFAGFLMPFAVNAGILAAMGLQFAMEKI